MNRIWKDKRRWMACILALVMALSLAACGESPAPAADNPDNTGSSESSSAENVSNETYRTIQIYQLDGEAEVTRNGKTMTPYVNMMLENGDKVTTMEGCHLYARLDEDKFLLAEPGSVFTLEATGTSQNSKTRIILEAGAVVNRITQPLSDGSSYEVTTPNSTMAVRGTGFRVAVLVEQDGSIHTTTQVTQGAVAVYTMTLGDVSVDFYMVEPNQKATVEGDNTDSNIVGDGAQELTEEEKQTLEAETQEFLEENADVLAQVAEELLAAAQEIAGQEPDQQAQESQNSGNTPPAQQTVEPPQQTTQPGPINDSDFVIDDNSLYGGGDSGGSNTTPTPAPTPTPTPSSYTVTFKYNGKVFGTQTVEAGKTAQMPTLQPTASGEWCAVDSDGKESGPFNFQEAINADTVVLWLDFAS